MVNDIDLSSIPDGEYIGDYSAFPVYVKVRVTVKDHKILSIKILEHQNGQGKPAEVIVSRVLDFQSLNVETISGATASSKVILKAIESALTIKK